MPGPLAAARRVMGVCCICGVAAGAQVPHPRLPDSTYVPMAQLGAAGGSGFLARWFATELRGAREPALYGTDSRRAPVVYRFTMFGGWGGVSVFRLERRDSAWTLVRKRTVPVRSWMDPARRIRSADSIRVADAAAGRVVAVILDSDRWRRPASACRHGTDGYEVLVEARDGAGYTLARCWVPDDATAPTIMATMRAFDELARETLDRSRPTGSRR